MSISRHHAEWLSLLEINGPFLSLETLLAVFPQGLPQEDVDLRRRLRLAYEEWLDNQAGQRPDPAIHTAWVRYVLQDVLALPRARRARGSDRPPLHLALPEHGETLVPDYVLIDPATDRPHLLVQVVPRTQRLESDLPGRAWKSTPALRMQALLYHADMPLGLVTNGEQWLLVYAPRGGGASGAAGYISWYAALWLEEPVTLRAWIALLGLQRFFGVPANETLAGLLARSAADQAQVTTQLGDQVRRAVEILVRAIDVADRDRGHDLLASVPEPVIYAAALTIMMRLVFLFYAEERGLFPLDDELYAASYAASPLSTELRKAADAYGEEVIERRTDAWHRLLATFRAIYGGIRHERLRLPAYGGSLFDPDRFPFLEGRAWGTTWADGETGLATPARPLPINNRTVLHLLEALQLLQVRAPGGERQVRRLSFRALDVEQIGHVYEGLLDHTAVRAASVVLGLGGAGGKEPELPLAELEGRAGDPAVLGAWLREQTGRSDSALRRALAAPPDLLWQAQLLAACGGDEALLGRILPFAGLVRADDLGHPIVILAGSVYVTAGAERRATGTHYTPRSLTEPIVQHTLEPLVYDGPAAGLPRDQWRLRPPAALLALKICDMAMGSGAFLVQVCRYLADRILEALDLPAGSSDGALPAIFAPILGATDPDERTVLARRLVAERCLYGVDKNPLAVEMAKLSLWLITLDKGRAFNFLDHALKCGDSLVGIHNLDQLRCWNLEGSGARQFGTVDIDAAIARIIRKRQDIESLPVLDTEDQAIKAYWLQEAEAEARVLKRAADLLIVSYYNELSPREQQALRHTLLDAAQENGFAAEDWATHLGDMHPFHWPLEFPEVFLGEGRAGFDGFVGNPPFIGGKRIRQSLGNCYRAILYSLFPGSLGGADLSAFFFLRAFHNLNTCGVLGLIATNTIAQGDTRLTGLSTIERSGGTIVRAASNIAWPGQAAVVVSIVHIAKADVHGPFFLNDEAVANITSFLEGGSDLAEPFSLTGNISRSFIGSYVNGTGFILAPGEADKLTEKNFQNNDVIFPYLTGEDLNTHPEQKPSRYVINFFDWPRERTLPGSWYALDARQQIEVVREGVVPADYPEPVAADYPDCFEIIKARVYPVRKDVNREAHRKYWWHYGDKRPALYAAIAPLQRVLVVARVTKYVAPVFVPRGWVYSEQTVVFTSDRAEIFLALQSTLHDQWAWRYSSTMGSDTLRYAPSDVLERLPLPPLENIAANQQLAESYHEHRKQLMLDHLEGITAIYNRFHNSHDTAVDVAHLRLLHVEIDYAIAVAYGWNDLDLGHDFRDTPQGARYTISEPARREVLRRLLELNHARHAEEARAAPEDSKAGSRSKAKQPSADKDQLTLL